MRGGRRGWGRGQSRARRSRRSPGAAGHRRGSRCRNGRPRRQRKGGPSGYRRSRAHRRRRSHVAGRPTRHRAARRRRDGRSGRRSRRARYRDWRPRRSHRHGRNAAAGHPGHPGSGRGLGRCRPGRYRGGRRTGDLRPRSGDRYSHRHGRPGLRNGCIPRCAQHHRSPGQRLHWSAHARPRHHYAATTRRLRPLSNPPTRSTFNPTRCQHSASRDPASGKPARQKRSASTAPSANRSTPDPGDPPPPRPATHQSNGDGLKPAPQPALPDDHRNICRIKSHDRSGRAAKRPRRRGSVEPLGGLTHQGEGA
jgi:hypothetical protein